jgi:hypothetical protein
MVKPKEDPNPLASPRTQMVGRKIKLRRSDGVGQWSTSVPHAARAGSSSFDFCGKHECRATPECHEVRTYSHPAGTPRCILWQRESDPEIAFRRRDPKLRFDLIFRPGETLLRSANPLSIVRG